jgi:hypothetical protein
MEKNLNVAPTEQELENIGFEDSYFGLIEFNLDNNTTIVVDTEKGIFRFIGSGTWIELTRQKINDAFALFNQPLPQWEKLQPKVGEVWENKLHRFHIIKGLNGSIWALILEGKDKSKVFDLSMVKYNHTKISDTLEDYYKEKFLKEGVVNMLYEVKEETTETATLEETIKPHEYSYKGLKADGKIPHDRSGEDHDSIEAFKKLLAICEALNGRFEKSRRYIPTDFLPYFCKEREDILCVESTTYCDTPIFFTSSKAFEAFKAAPENVELFKTFLKIK